jgi:hypothetical protein
MAHFVGAPQAVLRSLSIACFRVSACMGSCRGFIDGWISI